MSLCKSIKFKKVRVMTVEFSLAHLTLLENSPTEMIDIAHYAGYDYVSFRLTPVCKNEQVFPMLSNQLLRRNIKNRLADTGVKILDIELARLGPENEPEDYLSILDAGADFGAKHVICQAPDPEPSRVVDKISRLCELAKPFGLTVDVEFLPWSNIANLGDTANIIEQVNCNNAGILVDILHFARSESSLEQLRNLPKKWFNFVHLCDADKAIPTTAEGLIHTARYDRNFVGEGGINVAEIINAMPKVPYSLEIPNDKLRETLGNQEYAKRALDVARDYLEKALLVNS